MIVAEIVPPRPVRFLAGVPASLPTETCHRLTPGIIIEPNDRA